MTIPPLDPDSRSAGALDQHSTLFEPATRTEPPQARVPVAQPTPAIESIAKNPWHTDRNISWYGPGFYGNRTACGQRYSRNIVGVAHRTLPCGTLVQFKWHGKRAVAAADRLLSAAELEDRVYADYGCEREAHVVMPKKVA